MRITWHSGKSTKQPRSDLSVYVGRRLHQLRQKRQVTMRDVADDTELSVAFICQIENGQSCPSVETLWRLAEYFGVGIAWFVNGYHEKQAKTKG